MTTEIKNKIQELKSLRDKATQGEWHPCGCRYTMIYTELNSQEILDVCEVTPTDYTSDVQLQFNKSFIAESANRWNALLKCLEVAVEAMKSELEDLCGGCNCGHEEGNGLCHLHDALSEIKNILDK